MYKTNTKQKPCLQHFHITYICRIKRFFLIKKTLKWFEKTTEILSCFNQVTEKENHPYNILQAIPTNSLVQSRTWTVLLQNLLSKKSFLLLYSLKPTSVAVFWPLTDSNPLGWVLDCSSGEPRWSLVWHKPRRTSQGSQGHSQTFLLCSVQQTHDWQTPIY